MTAILVTHDQEEALAVSDAIGVMAAGRVLQVGPPADAYERPRTPFVAKFLGSANLLDGRSVGSTSPVVMVRPEHCVLNSSAPCRWQWPGKVTGVTFLGADLLAEVACEGSLSLRVRTRAAGGVRPGDAVIVGAPDAHLWPIPEADCQGGPLARLIRGLSAELLTAAGSGRRTAAMLSLLAALSLTSFATRSRIERTTLNTRPQEARRDPHPRQGEEHRDDRRRGQ